LNLIIFVQLLHFIQTCFFICFQGVTEVYAVFAAEYAFILVISALKGCSIIKENNFVISKLLPLSMEMESMWDRYKEQIS